MYLMRKISTSVLLLFFCLLIISYVPLKADSKTSAKVSQLLNEIVTYDFGRDRQILSEIADSVKSALQSVEELKQIELSMIKFLESDATYASKQFVCKHLSIMGTEDAVPVLSKMLVEENNSDIARYALERIPGEKVDKALQKALSKTDGKVKIGIINTIGERKDVNAVKALSKLLKNSDEQIASSAAAALGKIADDESIEALAKAEQYSEGKLRRAVLDAYLKCADQLVKNGKRTEADKIYEQLSDAKNPMAIRQAAIGGMVNAAGDNTFTSIAEILKKNDQQINTVAITLVRDLPASQQIDKITEVLPSLSSENKIQLIAALSDRGIADARDAVIKAVKDDDQQVRIAAIEALAQLGNENDVELLAQVAATGSNDEKEAAQFSLSRLKGEKVDQVIISKISTAENDIKIELITSTATRNITSATAVLLKTANDADRKVRTESYKSLGEIADVKYLPELIDRLLNVQNESDRGRIEKTVVAVVRKIPESTERASYVLKVLPKAKDVKTKGSLLKVLGSIGDTNAFPVLKSSLKDKNEDIQMAAIEALSSWQTTEPYDELLKIAQKSNNEIHQILALRGCIQLIGLESDRSPDETMKLYKTTMNLAKNDNEKKMILSGLANVISEDAMKMADEYLDNEAVQSEAEAAIIRISYRSRNRFPETTQKALEHLIRVSKNERFLETAKSMLSQFE
ncbi:HEAT repeat domain-containing protein [candidate division KSB1 bacterium]|nr:HEAT repeat domain-containing protein [candidate division KSB1 bacterium]